MSVKLYVIHLLLVSPFEQDHVVVLRVELMKHVAFMTHHDHHALSIENGSYSLLKTEFMSVHTRVHSVRPWA